MVGSSTPPPAATAPSSRATAEGQHVDPQRSQAMLVLESMRPKQWVKNFFVFAGLVFSGELLLLDVEVAAWTTFVAFCLISGATYLLNDACDQEVDRLNPRTAGRPIARGALERTSALIAAAVAAAGGLGLAAAVNLPTLAAAAAFVVLQIAYSNWLKHIILVDVIAISAGFVLRAYAGLVATEVAISPWILMCTGLLALFLALGKRRGAAIALESSEGAAKSTLHGYTVSLADELIAVVTPAIVIAYCLYAVLGARSSAMLLTAPFVIYGVFRAIYLIRDENGLAEDPTMLAFKDRPLLVCIGLWASAAAVISVATV